MEEDSRPLSHFLNNKNFPAARKKSTEPKEDSSPPTSTDPLTIVDNEIVINHASTLPRVQYKKERIGSSSFRTTLNNKRWSQEETLLFYKALKLCGTDFTLMEKIFHDKERKKIKNKFTKEERENPGRVHDILDEGLKVKFTKELFNSLKEEYVNIHL